jgi:hypothetical protein
MTGAEMFALYWGTVLICLVAFVRYLLADRATQRKRAASK